MHFSNFSPVLQPVPELGREGLLFGLPCLDDNIVWGLADSDGDVLLIDVPEAAPVAQFLKDRNLHLDCILMTHGHQDHVAGLNDLLRVSSAEVRAHRRLGLHSAIPLAPEGEAFEWKGRRIRVFDTSGHSDCDTSFYLAECGICFCGDTLFAGGCGRVFAGPPERMWQSLLKLRALPDDTLLCTGHDYAVENYRFAARTFPEMRIFRETLTRVEASAKAGRIEGPVSVGDQSRCNPMLMADHVEIAKALGMGSESPEEVFAEIRSRRSIF